MPEFDASEHVMLAEDPHDRVVIENCHPPGYVNPTPSGKYNLVAIGAGAAGLVSAGGAGALGAKAALIERRLTGGDCLNTGCVPSKAVIRAARAAYDAQTARAFGVHFDAPPRIEFGEAMERMRRLRARISVVDSVARFGGKYHVDVYLGEARFTGPRTLEVDGRRLEFDRAVIATGGRPAEAAIPGLREAGFLTSETVFTLTTLPRRLAVIGGGPIGCELAQAFRRFGAEVTIFHDRSGILPREDADAAAIVARQFAREGIRILDEARVLRAERRGAGIALEYEREGRAQALVCDAVLVAAGRVPNVEGLDLARAGIDFDAAGVRVDARLRTTNPRVYAAGDVCSPARFTHAADAMARTLLRNALFFGRTTFNAAALPRVTYTDPEIAHAGLGEADARAAGYDVATLTEHFEDNDRAILDGEEDGFARVHYDRRTGAILGGAIVARHAGEMIGELSLAVAAGLKMGALAAAIHPYPTQAEVLRKLGDAYNRGRLTPAVQSLFRRWFAWKRR